MQKQFSAWGALFLVGAVLIWMSFVGLGYKTTIGIFRTLEGLGGIAAILVGMAAFASAQASWSARLQGSLLVWAGGGLILGLLMMRFPFFWVAGLLFASALVADIFLIGILLVLGSRDFWMVIWSMLGPLFVLLIWGPALSWFDMLLGLTMAAVLNYYWLWRWYVMYREPCRAETIMHTAVNLTALWLHPALQWLGRLEDGDDPRWDMG